MSAFVFTANAGTDQLAITAHGLVTGDGPAVTRNMDGSLPGGLAAITQYWIIRIDADHVKLADSSAHALAGTAIDITSTGSGTNTLEIGIPYERARTYVAGQQVKSADLDAMMDSFKALHRLLTGQTQTTWTDCRPREKSIPITGGEIANMTEATTGLTATLGTWSFTSLMIDLPVGAQIDFYRVVFSKTGTTPSNYKLIYYPSASVGTPNPAPVVVDSGSANTAAVQDITVSVASPIPIAAGTRWHIAMNAGDTGDVVRQLEVFWR